MPLLRPENQWIGDDFQFWEANNGLERRQQTGRLRRKVLLVVVVVLKREVFVFGVVFLVVFVVEIVQLHKIHDADTFLVAGDVVEEMMEKCAHFEEGLHSPIDRRTGRQNLEGKKNGQVFFHIGDKGSGLGERCSLYIYLLGFYYISCSSCAERLLPCQTAAFSGRLAGKR